MTNCNIISTWERLANLMKEMGKISSIRVQETETRATSIGDMIYRCNEKVNQLAASDETAFLASAVVRKCFNTVLPSFVIPAVDILSGNTTVIDEIRDIQRTLDEDPTQEEWARVVEDFKKTTADIGLEIKMDISDLSSISDIVYNALTLVIRKTPSRVYQVREGQKSGVKPVMLNAIGTFDSVHTAVGIYESIPQKCFVAFFGLVQTYGQTDDKFSEWCRGKATGRKYNIMHDSGADHKITEEEYNSTPDKSSQAIYCLVRDGEDIRLFPMPIDASCYEDKFKSFTNYYGRRSTYAPIQIFFNDAPAATDKETVLPVVAGKKYWLLNEILDDEQKVWLPLFFLSVKKRFYESGETQSDKASLPEETAIYAGNSETAIVPCKTEYARYTVEEPEQFFTDRNRDMMCRSIFGDSERFDSAAEMCKRFGITSKDIYGAPFGTTGMCTAEQGKNIIGVQVGKAYYKAISERLFESWSDKALVAHRWYEDIINRDIDGIIERVLSTSYPFADVRVHKRAYLNDDGTPVMIQKNSWSSKLVPKIETTEMSEGRVPRRQTESDTELRYFFPATVEGKHPPVVLTVAPQSPEDLAVLCGCSKENLPVALRYAFVANHYIEYAEAMYSTRIHFGIETKIRIILGKREYNERVKKLINKVCTEYTEMS